MRALGCPFGRAALGLGLAATAGAHRQLARGSLADFHVGHGRIVPALSPKSDSHFFGHDYPDDFRPATPVEKDFDHPYPIVQESDVYDQDFVKDENSDNGEWGAQMEYDRLRTRMEKLQADAVKIKRKKVAMEKELEAERAKKQQVEEEEKKAEEAARKNESDAQAKVDEAKAAKDHFQPARVNDTAEDNTTVGVAGVESASKKVEKEMADIEDCKKQLEEAQEKLKKLHAEVKKLEDKDRAAHKKKDESDKEAAELKQKELEAQEELKKAKDRHDSALKEFESENGELHDMEARLEKAEARLRKLRRGVDQDGGVTRSGAAARGPMLHAALALAAAALCIGHRAAP